MDTRIVEMAEELRGRLLWTGILLVVVAAAVFPVAEHILDWLRNRTTAPLAAFGIADAFLALVTIALGAGAVAAMPVAAFEMLQAVAESYPALNRRSRWLFWFASMLLFFAGVGFCIQITVPYGSRFLLGYGNEGLRPVICVRQFVSFCLALTLGFGALFELPLIMALLAWLNLVTASLARRFRRYAVVGITIVSAVVTPTPDVFNLLLLALPLYLLFELGILGMRICERRRQLSPVLDSS